MFQAGEAQVKARRSETARGPGPQAVEHCVKCQAPPVEPGDTRGVVPEVAFMPQRDLCLVISDSHFSPLSLHSVHSVSCFVASAHSACVPTKWPWLLQSAPSSHKIGAPGPFSLRSKFKRHLRREPFSNYPNHSISFPPVTQVPDPGFSYFLIPI